MDSRIPTHSRFTASIPPAAFAAGLAWNLVIYIVAGRWPNLGELVAGEIWVSTFSLIILVTIGWPLFALLRGSSKINIWHVLTLGLVAGFALNAFMTEPLLWNLGAAGASAGGTAAVVCWRWTFRLGASR